MLACAKDFELHDGTVAVSLSPRVCHAADYSVLMAKVVQETPFTGKTPDDLRDRDVDWYCRRIRDMDAGPDTCTLLCSVDGKAIASANLWRYEREMERHRGVVSVSVLREYWGLGVGTHLLERLLDIGHTSWGLSQIELGVASDNLRAIGFYQHLGFRLVSVHPGFYKREGKLVDRHLMIHDACERE